MSNLEALKNLGAVVTGGSPGEIPGDKNADVIQYMAEHWNVKQAAAVPEAAGETVTQAEFKALLDALKAAGVMAAE